MQQLTPTICASAIYDISNNGINSNNTITLNDTRNNQDYRVRKMPDDKCWMIDNMKLATPGAPLTLTSDDTNLAPGNTFTIPANQATTTTTTTPTWNDPSNTEACINNTATNGDTYTYNPDSLTKCGYLYNWYAATAGTGTSDMTTGDAESSICPANWHLPSAGDGTATTANEFAVLNGAMVGTGPSMTSDATTLTNWRPTGLFEGVYAGSWWHGSFHNQGNGGYYWSSSAYSASSNRGLGVSYNGVYPGSDNGTKSGGYSVRCVLWL